MIVIICIYIERENDPDAEDSLGGLCCRFNSLHLKSSLETKKNV